MKRACGISAIHPKIDAIDTGVKLINSLVLSQLHYRTLSPGTIIKRLLQFYMEKPNLFYS